MCAVPLNVASGATMSDCTRYEGLAPDERRAVIGFCTDLIENGALVGKTLASAYRARGDHYRQLNRNDLAIDDYQEVLDIDARDASAHRKLGDIHLAAAHPDQAITSYSEAINILAIKMGSNSREGWRIASLYRVRADALVQLRKYEEAIADYTEAIKRWPNWLAFRRRADAYLDTGRYEDAIADYTQALHFNPDDAETYNDRGVAFLKSGAHGEAIPAFDEALKLNPELAIAFLNRCIAHHTIGKNEDGIKDCTEALRIGFEDQRIVAMAHNERGRAYANTGRLDEAIDDYDRALALAPTYAIAYHNRGKAYTGKESFELATRDFGDALRLGFEDEQRTAVAFLNRGRALASLGEYELAIHDFDAALSHNPDYIAAYRSRAQAHYQQNEHQHVIDDYTAVLWRDPTDRDAYIRRGHAYFSGGQWAAAAADLGEAWEIEPGDVGAALVHVAALARLGADEWLQVAESHASEVDLNEWPGPILSFALGYLGASEVLHEARTGPVALRRERGAQAYFFLGAFVMVQGDVDRARVYFERASAKSIPGLAEHALAQQELLRLRQLQ